MPGFCISNISDRLILKNYNDANCIQDSLNFNKWYIKRNVLKKFLNDKVFYENDKIIVIIDGIVLNKQILMEKHNCINLLELIEIISKENKAFFECFEGSFSGAIYYKDIEEWYIFTSPLGEKAIFYYQKDNRYVIGSQLNYITDTLKDNKIPISLNENSLNQFMAYGYYLDDSTSIEEISRLYPGEYIRISKESCKICTYFICDYEQKDINIDDAIDNLNFSFKKGLKKIFEKNKEYNLMNLLDISGGLDSRMICYSAKGIKEENVLLDCYSQSGTKDDTISKKIAKELNYDYVFRSIDNAKCMLNIDENILMNNGATIYYGITGGKDMLEMMNPNIYGIEITGLLGDIYDGSMVTDRCNGEPDLDYLKYRYSTTLKYGADFTVNLDIANKFKNYKNELYWFYTRGMIFGMTSYFIRQNFTEVATPFGDKEFLESYLSIPWEMRVKKHVLREWLIKYYPEASKIPYGNTGVAVRSSIKPYAELLRKYNRAKQKIKTKFLKEPINMSDVQYWYDNNKEFSNYINEYYIQNISLCLGHPKVKQNIKKLFDSGKVVDKLIAVSALSIIKCFYYIEENINE
ncbi:asparagine synthase-related protein [Terrisporobacter petrolearius]|uniref:asparagine synthase-related protein n=1 Tax=Terrisporobacter petrolearius TaxID=1460447 RepID=UPI0031CC9781